MQKVFMLVAGLLLAALLAASPARAYTPESGVWWNPAEPGYGLVIETQDDFMAVFVYSYDAAGNAQWYNAVGFMTGNSLFEGQLDRFTGGPCVGCPWRQNTEFLGAGGPIRIAFDPDDPTRATLTWGGRTLPIERFHFYLKRPEDEQALPGVPVELTKMLGEWQMVLDFTDNSNASFQYFGDIVILDRLASDNLGDFIDGCRAADSEIGFCQNIDIDEHYAAVEFDDATGEHVLVVENDDFTFASYFIQVGTNDFAGNVAVYTRGTTPSQFFPVHGFRTASRSFVQDGTGPSKQAGDVQKPSRKALPLAEAGSGTAKSLDSRQMAIVQRLEQRLMEARPAR